jgi:hypothetical protein
MSTGGSTRLESDPTGAGGGTAPESHRGSPRLRPHADRDPPPPLEFYQPPPPPLDPPDDPFIGVLAAVLDEACIRYQLTPLENWIPSPLDCFGPLL